MKFYKEPIPRDGTPVLAYVNEGSARGLTTVYWNADMDYVDPIAFDTHGCGCCGGGGILEADILWWVYPDTITEQLPAEFE